MVHYLDLPALEPVMEPAANMAPVRHVSFEDLLRLADEDIHGKIRGAALGPGVTHMVCFENLDQWSSQLGRRQFLAVGEKPEGAAVPSWTLAKVLGTPYFRLGDVPSRFAVPVAYASVETVREALPAQEQKGEIAGRA